MPSQLSDIIPTSHELHLFTVKSAAQFAIILKQCDKCYCFILNFTHCVAHGDNKVAKVTQHSYQILDVLEKKSIQLCLVSLRILYGSIDNNST